jgi:hypothetical protein
MLAARGEVRRDRTLAIYVAATLVAIGAAALDPAGIRTVLSLPPAAPFAGLGLFWLRRVARRSSADGGLVLGVGCHRGWLLAGASSAILFIGVLGPGIVFD